MSKIVTKSSAFICKFTVAAARREEFNAIFDKLWRPNIEIMERDTNFVYYGWGRNENEFFAVESWKSEEATNAVRATDLFKESLAKLIDCCSAPMTLQILSGMEDGRDVFDVYPAGRSGYHPSGNNKETIFL